MERVAGAKRPLEAAKHEAKRPVLGEAPSTRPANSILALGAAQRSSVAGTSSSGSVRPTSNINTPDEATRRSFPGGSTLKASLTAFRPASSAPSARENLQYVHGSVINVSELMRNAPTAREKTSAPTRSAADSSQEAVIAEVDRLLQRRSSHADEANDEWFQAYSQRMDKLARHEYASSKAAKETESINVSGHRCNTCRLLGEVVPDVCVAKGHDVQTVRMVKRFFICGSCDKRDRTLTLEDSDKAQRVHPPPNRRCVCGGYAWQACGMRGRAVLQVSEADHKDNLAPARHISAAAEWTSREDKVAMALRISSLHAARPLN